MKRKSFKKYCGGLCVALTIISLGYCAGNWGDTDAFGATKNRVTLSVKNKTLTVGEKFKLKVKGARIKKVSWKSMKKSVATVSKKGVVKAKKEGRATIVASVKFKNKKAIKKLKTKITVVSKEKSTASKNQTAEVQTTKVTELQTTNQKENTTEKTTDSSETTTEPTTEPTTELTTEPTTELETPTAETETMENNALNRAVKLVDSFEANNNILVSPTSLDYVLAMVANSGDEDIKEDVEKYLGRNLNEINQYYYDLMIKAENDVFLNIANSFWYDQRYTLNLPFANLVKQHYLADVFAEPMDNGSIDKMNKWAKDNTDGLIDKIVDYDMLPIYSSVFNAVLFDGKWTSKFDAKDTFEQEFNVNEETKKIVKMMPGTEYSYFENEYATGFEKTYGTDKRYSFIGILPKKEGEFNLSDLDLTTFLASKEEVTTYIRLPKLELGWDSSDKSINKYDLNDVLNNLNLGSIFDARFLDDLDVPSAKKAFQVTKILVDEDGTKAAAVTGGIEAEGDILEDENAKRVYLDRPFAYMIVDNTNGEILFIGKCLEP